MLVGRTTSSIGTISGGSLAIRSSPSTTSVSFANAFRLSFDCAFATLRSNRLTSFRLVCRTAPGEVVASMRGVPEVQVAHPRELRIAWRYGPAPCPVDRLPRLQPRSRGPTGHGEAGHQPLDVPFERARQCLVEIVDAEDQASIGRGEGAEIGQVGVAAELDLQAGPGRAGQVGRHRGRSPAEEGERRHQHPPITDGTSSCTRGSALLFHQLDRISPIGGRLPFGVLRARHARAYRLTGRLALGRDEVRQRPRGRVVVSLAARGSRGPLGGLGLRHRDAPFSAGKLQECCRVRA